MADAWVKEAVSRIEADYCTGDAMLISDVPSCIEGTSRLRNEPSFVRSAVDRGIEVRDAASIAVTHTLAQLQCILDCSRAVRCQGMTESPRCIPSVRRPDAVAANRHTSAET